MSSDEHTRQRREVENRMMTWKCRIENPPRIVTPTLVPTNSAPAMIRSIPLTPKLEEKLPKILSFGNQASGGGGAPRRTPSGRIQTFLRGDPEIRFHQKDSSIFERSIRYQFDKEAIHKYKEDLDRQIADRRKPSIKHSESSDLATIMSARNTYAIIRRWESLPKLNSTDVTRAFVMSPSRTPDSLDYKRELEGQLESKRKTQELHSNHEKYLSSLHFTSFNNFWGKPGGGAPKISKKKENLFKLLNNSR